MSAENHVQAERDYIKIFWLLFGLTAFEVGATYMPFNKVFLALVLVTMAFVKAGLVAAFYMHLKLEGKLLYLVCATPVVLVAILTCGLMPDVGNRVGARTKQDAPHGAHASAAPGEHGASAAPGAPEHAH